VPRRAEYKYTRYERISENGKRVDGVYKAVDIDIICVRFSLRISSRIKYITLHVLPPTPLFSHLQHILLPTNSPANASDSTCMSPYSLVPVSKSGDDETCNKPIYRTSSSSYHALRVWRTLIVECVCCETHTMRMQRA